MSRLPTLVARLVLVAAPLLAAGCSDGDDDDDADSTTTTSTTTTTTTTSSTTTTSTSVPSTTTPTTSSTTTTTGAPGSSTTIVVEDGAPSPEEAAQGLHGAWKAGSRGAAAQVAEPAAVDTIFERPYAPPELTFVGCSADGDTSACTFLYEGGARVFRVQGTADTGYRVVEINDLAD